MPVNDEITYKYDKRGKVVIINDPRFGKSGITRECCEATIEQIEGMRAIYATYSAYERDINKYRNALSYFK